jgi:ATP-dependent RNA helicase DeaD
MTTAFASLGAPEPLAAALAARGYQTPTPVQEAVLQESARGRDLLVSARTGSGKTVAFGLSIASELLPLPTAGKPLGLVVAPTRELAQQVARELSWLFAEARVAACVGGADVGKELRALKAGVHLVVGTPGRLCDHLERGSLQLGALKALVLDEADEMLDLGFRDELERILSKAPVGRRTLLFSATIPNAIEQLARKYTREALRIAANPPAQAHADIELKVHAIAAREREHAVVNSLRFHEAPAAIVFCATREGVNHLAQSLTERGFAAVALSGELTQAERTRALHALRDGRARVLVATDVAARGLDLPDVSLIIQADAPQNAEVLQHRSGRTGRAGRKGTSVLLVPPGARRAVESMLRKAGLRVAFTPPPDADVIRVRDRDRLVREIESLLREPSEDDLALARLLLRERDAELMAAALVKLRREALPAPEDLPFTAELAKKTKAPATQRAPASSPFRGPKSTKLQGRGLGPQARGPARAVTAGLARGPRPEARGRNARGAGVWFRVNVGRSRNADPRWLLPILCRRGEVDRRQIGRIEVMADETRFEVAPAAAADFSRAAKRPDSKDPNIRITQVETRP